ncbi:hypothetical protein DTX80_05365 [Bacilli bacterium]|nr:hypothetical protein DEJ64_05440 [Bacilli bacterium]PZD90699.1 hypothetical protein DEJ60_02240 [Bacilli bacterium]PZD91822.1 hypothetical protein DEJ66_05245 [Bacilli bacterium]RCO06554.1 hypothetical protein DTX80_05365 [Bacilli bacterium]RCO10546.1 hypothetical protein DTX79_03765 [Bacilli bacterium]
MKKFSFLFMILAVVTLILAACGEGNNDKKEDANSENAELNETTELKYKPEDINPDTDVCEICAMAVADDQHATQIVLKSERSLKFDDLGCLYAWITENGEDEIGAKFVRDFNTEEWVLMEDATYVFDEEINTPMAYGIISFKDRADAESYIEENGFGEILTADDLKDHKWEMMNHDHDHGHDGHDGHDDHAHGFHAEGFDMHFTELENATVGEETKLEVNITLDEAGLEGAKVRYEIWKEDNKDNTDWVDASEVNTGNYVADYSFKEAGTYHVQVHVEDDHDLHEHMEYEVIVKE